MKWQELLQWAREKIKGAGSNHYFLEIVANLCGLGAFFTYVEEV